LYTARFNSCTFFPPVQYINSIWNVTPCVSREIIVFIWTCFVINIQIQWDICSYYLVCDKTILSLLRLLKTKFSRLHFGKIKLLFWEKSFNDNNDVTNKPIKCCQFQILAIFIIYNFIHFYIGYINQNINKLFTLHTTCWLPLIECSNNQ
jgi:hypothetical protein